MFTLKNIGLINLLADHVQSELTFKTTSPLSKLLNVNSLDVDNVHDVLSHFANDTAHEEFMSAMEDEMTSILQSRVKFIRNEVSSTIEDLVDVITTKADEEVPRIQSNRIVTSSIPRLLTSEWLIGKTEQYDNIINSSVDFGQGFPPLQPDELVQLITKFLDEDTKLMVNELVDSMDINIVDIYNKYFRGIVSNNYPQPITVIKPAYIQFIHLERTVAYLLATAFYKEPLETVNLKLDSYNALLAKAINNYGKQVLSSVNLITNIEKNNKSLLNLVSHSDGPATIVLNRKAYDLFLEVEGVTPETILGLYNLRLLSSINITTVDDGLRYTTIIEKANAEIQRQNSYIRSVMNNNRTTTFIRILMSELNKLVDTGEFIVPEGKTKLEVIRECKTIVSEYGTISPDKLYYFIRKVVCLGLYPNSGAFIYLTSMDSHQESNPNLKPREAATLALRDMLVDWDISQLS